MNEDIETLRAHLPEPDEGCNAALDRLEAMLESSRYLDADAALERAEEAEAEVERLRAENKELREWSEGNWWDEVERLREEKNAIDRNWHLQETELQELRQIAEDAGAEVGKLREELERACEDPDAAVREENERLRESVDQHHPTIPCTICGG